MSSIIHSLSDVVTSLVELVWSFFTTAGDLAKQTLNFTYKFASELVDLVINFFKGLVDLAGGIAGFVLGNVLMLGVLAAGIFAFLQYQRSQGKTVQVGNKKLN